MTAKMKVKVGVRLLMAEARVGELYSIPLYRHKLFEILPYKTYVIFISKNCTLIFFLIRFSFTLINIKLSKLFYTQTVQQGQF